MGDNLEGYIQCRRFKRINGTVLYCEGADGPLVFGSRENLKEFLNHHCNRVTPFCSYFSERTACAMERIGRDGHTECRGYKITCHRDTCPYYKSEEDRQRAELKTAERLLDLPKEKRKAIKRKYRL